MSSTTQVIVSGTRNWLEQQIKARQHQWSADEPTEHGGTDVGPTPYELLLSALGSCIAITVRMYAKKKEWELEDIVVKLSHHKIHATDCEDCEQETGYVDVIEKSVYVTGNLTDEQKDRLVEIAGRCPVHRSLENSVKIR